jgi:hypothetical protein
MTPESDTRDPEQAPAERLVGLLETLPSEARQEVTAWLLGEGRPLAPPPALSVTWPLGSDVRRRLIGDLPAGEDSQLITIRLPADRHTELRTWCAEHGFTMAAVVRGLIERFLEDQLRAGAPARSKVSAG